PDYLRQLLLDPRIDPSLNSHFLRKTIKYHYDTPEAVRIVLSDKRVHFTIRLIEGIVCSTETMKEILNHCYKLTVTEEYNLDGVMENFTLQYNLELIFYLIDHTDYQISLVLFDMVGMKDGFVRELLKHSKIGRASCREKV